MFASFMWHGTARPVQILVFSAKTGRYVVLTLVTLQIVG